MNRALFYLLIVALIVVRVMPLHGHLLADEHAHATAAAVHHAHPVLHSHGLSDIDATSEHHGHAVEIDLLGSALARDVLALDLVKANALSAFTAAIVLLFAVLWFCIERRRFIAPLFFVPSPLRWQQAPRAPPR